MVVAVVIRSRVSNNEWHLYDTAAIGAACVDVREAVLFQFSGGAGVDRHDGKKRGPRASDEPRLPAGARVHADR